MMVSLIPISALVISIGTPLVIRQGRPSTGPRYSLMIFSASRQDTAGADIEYSVGHSLFSGPLRPTPEQIEFSQTDFVLANRNPTNQQGSIPLAMRNVINTAIHFIEKKP
jgi:hypothetical protein